MVCEMCLFLNNYQVLENNIYNTIIIIDFLCQCTSKFNIKCLIFKVLTQIYVRYIIIIDVNIFFVLLIHLHTYLYLLYTYYIIILLYIYYIYFHKTFLFFLVLPNLMKLEFSIFDIIPFTLLII